MKRCEWANSHPLLIEYHDHEWGVPVYDDKLLFEDLILETFSTGLSWLIVLKKRDAFREAFDNFDIEKVSQYDEDKVESLLKNSGIVRSRAKIKATIQTAKIVLDIQKEYGSFSQYLWNYVDNKVMYINENIPTSNVISDKLSADLKKRGVKFFGTITTFSFLQATGLINCHYKDCFVFRAQK